ncbi:phage portal protein [Breoghania sp.]|uniref:phage portal protein n=1 Tax=Breoghania sp. TaxID=2065378 RepID=UPI002AAB1570|nr:phage portal protein [Breoghania sp.]
MTASVPIIPRGSDAARPTPAAQYLRPDRGGFVQGWPQPALRDARHDVRMAWGAVASRSIETIQNNGWMSGAVDQAIGDTLGSGLKLNAIPDAAACGFGDDKAAADWSRGVEKRWRTWADDPLECDLRGKMTVDAMAEAALRSHYGFGEAAARIVMRRRPFAATQTKVQMFSPLRIVQETREEARLYQGVFQDADGMATGYRVKARVDGIERTVDLPARDRDGRPLVVHVFDGAADQTRGISPFAPILKVFRQADQLADATLVAAMLQTIFAATVKSNALSEEVFEGLQTQDGSGNLTGDVAAFMDAKADWWKSTKIDLGQHGRIAHLFFGEELEFHNTNHPHNNYLPFMRNLLREIARCIGVSYESMAFDYEGATYSSVRMGISSLWPQVTRRRKRVSAPFYQAVYEAWLEEQIAQGWIAFPGGYAGFLAQRGAACRAKWGGPAKPTADDLKAAKGMGERLERGVSSLEIEAGELGHDWEEVAEQRAQESARYAELGLADPHAAKGSPLAAAVGDPDLADEEDQTTEGGA